MRHRDVVAIAMALQRNHCIVLKAPSKGLSEGDKQGVHDWPCGFTAFEQGLTDFVLTVVKAQSLIKYMLHVNLLFYRH